MNRFLILTGSLLLLFTSCENKIEKKEPVKEEKMEGEGKENHDENTATLTTSQMKTIGIELGSVEQKELTNSLKANGMLTVPNQNKAFVTPLYSGVVKSLNVQPGSFVKQGQVIATIVNPDLLRIQERLLQLNGQIALAETEAKRQKELVEGNAAPLKRLQQSETELNTLKAERSGLQKQLGTIGASENFSSQVAIKAPIGGTVSKVSAQLGSNVDVSTPIAEIVNNSQLHLDLFVYEKDLPRLKPNQTIHFTLTNNPGKEYDALIYSIGTAFESDSKTIPVHAKVMGEKTGLIDGMNITALVSLDKSTVPAVPADAIVNYKGQDFVFVLKKNGEESIFERIPVAKGTSDVGYSEITLLKEVPDSARIVTKGAFFILSKMTNTGEHED